MNLLRTAWVIKQPYKANFGLLLLAVLASVPTFLGGFLLSPVALIKSENINILLIGLFGIR